MITAHLENFKAFLKFVPLFFINIRIFKVFYYIITGSHYKIVQHYKFSYGIIKFRLSNNGNK